MHGNDILDGRIRAAARGTAPFIVFMDADCRLQEDTMLDIALGFLAQRGAAVGGLLIDGEAVHSAGYAISIGGKPYARYKGWPLDHPKVNRTTPLQALPFGFLATRRDAYRKLGFRPEFRDLPFADADYCVRLMRSGQPVFYDPAIKVETAGLLDIRESQAAVQLLIASAQPVYDEWSVL